MKPPSIKSVLLQGVVGGFIGFALFALFMTAIGKPLLAQQHDPEPRFEFLGEQWMGRHASDSPIWASVFVDKATGDEIVCFGQNSCWKSGRKR